MQFAGVRRLARRVFTFFVGSKAAQFAGGGVAAVLITGVIVVVGPPGEKAIDAVTAGARTEVRDEPPAEPAPEAPVTPAAPTPPAGAGAAQGLGAAPPVTPPAPPIAVPPAANPAPARTKTTDTVSPKRKAPAVTYDAIAGLGCTGRGTSYSHHGWFKKGDQGWWTLAYGSTREGGCDGRFDDMPLSGKANEDTPGQALLYGFQVGAGRHRCTLSLYVPTSSSPRDVAVAPVRLAVLTGTDLASPLYTSPAPNVFISQRDNHSSWVPVGTYPVTNGTIGVKVTNRGSSAGYTMTDPHIAGGAMRARCAAA